MNIKKDLLLLIKSSQFGEGEPDLGEKLLKSFLSMFIENDQLPARAIFMNSGVYLTTQDSPVQDILQIFQDSGTEILSCATCLSYYQREDKLIFGKPTNMKDTVKSLLGFGEVITV
jgi:selenium metabolism protein YedF